MEHQARLSARNLDKTYPAYSQVDAKKGPKRHTTSRWFRLTCLCAQSCCLGECDAGYRSRSACQRSIELFQPDINDVYFLFQFDADLIEPKRPGTTHPYIIQKLPPMVPYFFQGKSVLERDVSCDDMFNSFGHDEKPHAT
jgi:hypothetical protein